MLSSDGDDHWIIDDPCGLRGGSARRAMRMCSATSIDNDEIVRARTVKSVTDARKTLLADLSQKQSMSSGAEGTIPSKYTKNISF